MALAILCGLLFGILGAGLGAAATGPSGFSHPTTDICSIAGFLAGAIFGAIVGGTGAIVAAIKERDTPKPEPSGGWLSYRIGPTVVLVIILAAIIAIALLLYTTSS